MALLSGYVEPDQISGLGGHFVDMRNIFDYIGDMPKVGKPRFFQ